MKAFAALLLIFCSVPAGAQGSDQGPVTVQQHGTMDGRSYNSITLTPATRGITFHFNDGSQFTQSGGDPFTFARIYRSALEERGLAPRMPEE